MPPAGSAGCRMALVSRSGSRLVQKCLDLDGMIHGHFHAHSSSLGHCWPLLCFRNWMLHITCWTTSIV
jgi:hypothetical protein